MLAPPLLLGLRVGAGHGPVDWHRSRQPADAPLWMLWQSFYVTGGRDALWVNTRTITLLQ